MLKYAIVFAVISLIAGALGFGGVAAGAAGIAKVLPHWVWALSEKRSTSFSFVHPPTCC
jgi:uncharacterized membrane protein YtjA (UPF0391 family)